MIPGPEVSVMHIHWNHWASGHLCFVIEVNMHLVSIFYQICYKPVKRVLLTSYFKQTVKNHLQYSFSYILRWYLKYINIQIDYTSGLKNRWIWPQCPKNELNLLHLMYSIFVGLLCNHSSAKIKLWHMHFIQVYSIFIRCSI